MDLSRRDTLLGTAALAAAPLMTSTQVKAAAPVADKQAPSFYRYKVGDAVVTVVSDGKNVFPLTDAFITNAKKEDVAAELEKNVHAAGHDGDLLRAAGDPDRRQDGRDRHRQRRARQNQQQGQ